jgi:hypothetical protein
VFLRELFFFARAKLSTRRPFLSLPEPGSFPLWLRFSFSVFISDPIIRDLKARPLLRIRYGAELGRGDLGLNRPRAGIGGVGLIIT